MTTTFRTTREDLVSRYATAGQRFRAATTPLKSTLPIRYDVVDVVLSGTGGYCTAIARRGQTLEFYGYGVGDSIASLETPTAVRRATEADTNLGKGRSTNGAMDFVIEGVSFGCKAHRIRLPGAAASAYATATGAALDPSTLQALQGTIPIGADTFGLFAPPQVLSSVNLEQAMMQALLPSLSLEFEWDRARTEKISTVDLLPEGGAKSYLRANGTPAAGNKYRIPEGYAWRRDGQPDSEFIARVQLRDDIAVPLLLPPSPLGDEGDGVAPEAIILDLQMRLHGLGLTLPSAN